MAWLPLTGLVVGLCLAALGLFFQNMGFPRDPLLKGMLIVSLELWIGGASITRGFSHACEGLFSRLGRKRSLEIMEDSRLGAPGAISLILLLAGKLALLSELSLQGNFIFLLAFYPCWSRWALSFAACNYQAAREEGMAFFFKAGQKPVYLVLSSVFTLLILIIMPRYFYPAALVSFVSVLFCCVQVQTRLGGQTEDTFGFAAAAAELSFLLFAAVSGTLFQYLGG